MLGSNFHFCNFWLPGADSASEGSDADEGETQWNYIGSGGEDDD